MCGLGRSALVDTCTNCGLVLKVKPRAIAVRPTAGPKPGGARRERRDRPWPSLSSNLFSLGVILVALGFAAHVGHAVMLANGRRLMPVLAPAQQPAYAGVVTRLVRRRADAARRPRRADAFAAPSPLSRAAIGLTFVGWLALGASMLLRPTSSAAGRGATCSSSASPSRSR